MKSLPNFRVMTYPVRVPTDVNTVIVRGNKRELSPCYDLLNSTLALGGRAFEESALPLSGKKKNFTKNDFFRYLGRERLELTEKVIDTIGDELEKSMPEWKRLIGASFLPATKQDMYLELIGERAGRLFGWF